MIKTFEEYSSSYCSHSNQFCEHPNPFDIEPLLIPLRIIKEGYGDPIHTFSPEMQEFILNRAKEYFGTTSDLKECGYIMEDGTLLDFSGKKFGGMSGERSLDHRQIHDMCCDYETGEELPEFKEQWVEMNDFIAMGNIRFHLSRNGRDYYCSFDLIKEPSFKQLSLIKNITRICQGDVTVDIDDDKMGEPICSKEYSENDMNSNYSTVANEISRYFREGIKLA